MTTESENLTDTDRIDGQMPRIDIPQIEPLVAVEHATMKFPGVLALNDVSFDVRAGECHALVGENGAGKSTLAKAIIGENVLTDGSISVGGNLIDPKNWSVRESQRNGIAAVHQEFQLVEEMSGLENIFLGHYLKKSGLIDKKALREKAKSLMDLLQMKVNLDVPVKNLRTAEKQIVQLARALALQAKVVILDELTAVLPEADIQQVFRIVELLKQQGIGVIYISHRLDEIFEVCDRYTVLRDGEHIETGEVSDLSMQRLVNLIAGRELSKVFPQIDQAQSDLLLHVDKLTSSDFSDITIDVHAGEVVGIAGLVGAGKTELLQAIFGNHHIDSGTISIDGREVNIRSPKEAIKLGIGFVPDERKKLGLNMMMDIWQNATLAAMPRFRMPGGFMRENKEREISQQVLEEMRLAYSSVWQGVEKLSGGNQQKIVIAKWVIAESRLFLMDEPTRGIDVGAKSEVYNLIAELTAQGKGVVIVSQEVEELLGLAHRIYVMYEGEVVDVVEGSRKTQEEIMTGLLGVSE